MSERDQHPATPHAGAAPQPQSQWESETTPGMQATGNAPYSGAGASAVGGGWSGGAAAGAADTRGYPGHEQYQPADVQRTEVLDSGRRHDQYRGTTPEYSTAPVTLRRPDVLAGLLLVLAGIAAAISLLLDWVTGTNGWDLVRDGLEDFDAGSWQPPVIVLAGGVLLVLGLLVLLPARSHRTLGVLALFATLAALTAVVVVLNQSLWTWDFFEAGFWVACAVPVLGLLGSLKAMLSTPRTR